MPEVMSVSVLAGGDDFLLHVGVPRIEHLRAFLVDRLSRRREVTGFRTSVIFRHVRNPAVGVLTDTAFPADLPASSGPPEPNSRAAGP